MNRKSKFILKIWDSFGESILGLLKPHFVKGSKQFEIVEALIRTHDGIIRQEDYKKKIGNIISRLDEDNPEPVNMIDYIRPNVNESVFTATNIAKVNTQGIEFDANYNFMMSGFSQNLSIGYTYLNDDILDQNKDLSRYSLNTLKHQFITRFTSRFFKNISQNIIYKHAERSNGQSYNVWDASLIVNFNAFDFTITANNIFDANYIEAGFVPMPPSNVLFGLRYSF